MISRIKITGLIIFVCSFIVGFLRDELRESFVLGVGMLFGLLILAACYYYESRKSRKIDNIERKIYFNGKFYSMDSENNVYSAIYIENGIIEDLGDDEIILKTYGDKTDIKTDLKGKSIVPGFNDSHMHLYSYGKNLDALDLRNVESVEDEKDGSSVEEIMEVVENAQKKLLEYGITSVQTDDFQYPGGAWENTVKAYVNLLKKEKLRLRITEQCLFFKIENFREFIEKGAHGIDIKDKFRIGPLKLLADGSLGARTALLEKEYSDDEGNIGISAYTEEQIDEFIDTAHKNGMPVAVHAIGDKMIDIVLDSIHKARGINDSAYLNDGIVHCQLMNENLFNKFNDFNIGSYLQPVFTVNDWKIVESRVGAERTKYSYNWKTFVDRGLRPSFGTDAPVESPNPLENIYAAVTRKDFDGLPEEGWKAEQKLTVEEALKCYTLNSARMTGEESKKGSLEKGKFSDFSVLSEDIFKIDTDGIKNVYVEMTVINGEIEYLANNNL